MRLDYDDETETFRAQFVTWLEANLPDPALTVDRPTSSADIPAWARQFQRRMFDDGWLSPAFPPELGGRNASLFEQMVYLEELGRRHVTRSFNPQGLGIVSATIVSFGSDDQIRDWAVPIMRAEKTAALGMSEPDAGSDLAALATRAVLDGDQFVVNGQKLWASGARHADWCLLLARTDPDAPKRKGISYFLMDMSTPGVDVRPIRNAVGDSHFCEIFLDDVVIPADNLIGAENAGWQVAQATLGAERGMTMLELAERLAHAGFRRLVEAAPVDDPVVADRLAQFEIEITGLRGMCRRVVEGAAGGPADASIVKLYYSELLQRLTDFAVEISGPHAHTALTKPMSSGWESGSWVLDFVGSWEWTIPGGASEIQRSIIAERGLGLPREPSVA